MIRFFFKELFKMARQLRSWLGPLSVFILILVAFPLTQDIDTKFSHQTTFSFLWIISLLVIMLSTEKVFLEDFDDGSMDQHLLKSYNFSDYVSAKATSFFLLIGIPLSCMSWLFLQSAVAMTNLNLVSLLSFLLSNFIFINFCFFGNAVSLKRGSLLGLLIITPLLFPVLIILGKMLSAALLGLDYSNFLLLLLGCSLISGPLMPFVISYILKIHLE